MVPAQSEREREEVNQYESRGSQPAPAVRASLAALTDCTALALSVTPPSLLPHNISINSLLVISNIQTYAALPSQAIAMLP